MQHTTRNGDLNLFVDDDGTGYVVYADISRGFELIVERLAPDFLGTTGEHSGVLNKGVEAPAMFKRNGWYYVLFGRTCCFLPAGVGRDGVSRPVGAGAV